MKMRKRKSYRYILGLNQASLYGSACLMSSQNKALSFEIFLKERFSRKKVDGLPIDGLIRAQLPPITEDLVLVGASSFGGPPILYEEKLDGLVGYFEKLQRENLQWISQKYNPHIIYSPHHYCHAMAALAVSPFKKSIIVVFDGGGSDPRAFPKNHPEYKKFVKKLRKSSLRKTTAESWSVYLQNGAQLKCVEKEWDSFRLPEAKKLGLGNFYETAARFIFNSMHEAGKVMGLAPFGTPSPIKNRILFYKNLPWSKSFKAKGKKHWEQSGHFKLYADVSASVQNHFEKTLLSSLARLKKKYHTYDNLILTGGCALNCVANMKVVNSGMFKAVYVPPFPSDESISLGAACHIKYRTLNHPWRPIPLAKQRGNFGHRRRPPIRREIKRHFPGAHILKPKNIERYTAKKLFEGQVVGWFQDQSESGPRALGQRSILASPFKRGIKDRLNNKVKFRESFRPYSAACLWEKAHIYFDVAKGFDSPFMSFAPQVRHEYQSLLKEVSHIDGSSRLQTVRRSQNQRFYDLLNEFEKNSGLPCLLNTSLNVMGEPIVETVADAARFFKSAPIEAMVIGEYFIFRGAPKR